MNKQTIALALYDVEKPLADFCCDLADIAISEKVKLFLQVKNIVADPLVRSIESGVYRIIEKQFRKIINDI
jgi:hypothetical protein